MIISETTKLAIERYTAHAEERARGSCTIKDWEDARSYAVEALQGILYDNPDVFDHKSRIRKILDDQKRGTSTVEAKHDR